MDIKSNSPTKTFGVPSFLKAAIEGVRPVTMTLEDVIDTNVASSSSFKYDPRGEPLKSTQQLNVDWSQFENHCFFMPAEVLVNATFDQIINGFPFDGTKLEIERFFDELTGFERWVFDQFPKYHGFLMFSGTQVGEDGALGNWISIQDKAGALFPELAKNATGLGIMNPGDKSFSVETHVFVAPVANDLQVICQKQNDGNGFSLYLEPSVSSAAATLCFNVVSGSTSVFATGEIPKGTFTHIAAVLNKDNGPALAALYQNFSLLATSRTTPVIGNLALTTSPLTIASGSSWINGTSVITPTQTFSGSLDEFRFFHSVRTIAQQQAYHQKLITASDDLKLYYKFNEPPPPLVPDNGYVNAIVLDSSGNSLHALVNAFVGTLRKSVDDEASSLMIYERDELSPVLFPAYPSIVSLNETLLQSASLYDAANPNIITKLVPENLILQGQSYEGFKTQLGDANNAYGGEGIPGQGEMGSTHLILSFLYVYAKFFDNIKILIDQFANMRSVSHDTHDTVPNPFLIDVARTWGVDLPPLFNESTIDQYIYAENIDDEINTGPIALRTVQDELLKRVLIYLPKILRSKGTRYAIEAFLRALGIDPNNSVRIREYGGPTEQMLDASRERHIESGLMINMSSGSIVTTPFLTASRIEPGFPTPYGTFVQKDVHPPHGISNNANDGLLTRASWTYEAIYHFPLAIQKRQYSFEDQQSLVRFIITGSTPNSERTIMNLVVENGSKLTLYARPGNSANSPLLAMPLNLSGDGLFDGDPWNVSFGYIDSSESGTASGTYFLRAAQNDFGDITKLTMTSSYFSEVFYTEDNVLKTKSSDNVSGSSLRWGNTSMSTTTGGAFLNDDSVDSVARTTMFVGRMSNVRFWTKSQTEIEFKEHVRNYKSVGVDDPWINYNFNTTSSGSWERLRLFSIWQQDDYRYPLATASLGLPTGSVIMWDLSLNGNHLTGSQFTVGTLALGGQTFGYSYLSPYFDEAVSADKIRIRSAKELDVVEMNPWTQFAPVYEVPPAEKPTDSSKFSVEFSLIDSLNRDIITIFSTFEKLNEAIGAPELAFSSDYPDLEQLRNIYFTQVQEKINFRAFFDFFRWFDVAIGTFIEQLIPHKSNFKGTNFLIESHMLERHKLQYHFEEMYVGESNRSRIRDVLLVQQVVGSLRKY
jgi:hypothetical protein